MKLKALIEKKNTLLEERDGIVEKVETEVRALEDAEMTRLEQIKAEVRALDNTISELDEQRDYKAEERGFNSGEREEEKRFLEFCRGEERNFNVGNNGSVIPAHIANRILEKVKELSPIYAQATKFHVGGDLAFPVYEEGITATYVDDLAELTETSGKFTTVKLENFVIGTLTKVSKSLINRTDIDVISFIVNKVAGAIAEFLEKELIMGQSKVNGLITSQQTVTAASTTITVDDLIDAQMAIPEAYQSGAVWIMHKKTLQALRKLKDGNGDYLLNRDVTTAFGWSLLGKPVYITESADEVGNGKTPIFYGDMSGLYIKLAQNVELQMLMEKYATQHAIGVVAYVECDAKIVETQKIVAIKVGAGKSK
jgi:HK97 family phage major capsid protein